MLDLFELERLFSNWLKARSEYTCEVIPRYKTYAGNHKIEVEIYRKDANNNKELINTISASGKNMENMWDKVFDSMFAYFMEVGKNAV